MRAVVSLGSNLEPRAEYLARALERLEKLPQTHLVAVSEVSETKPVEVPKEFAAFDFLNQIAIFETVLAAPDFSRRMHDIENELGRVRTVKNGPRTIDLDLVSFGALVQNDPELILPHPRAADRDFVMMPLRRLWMNEFRKHYNEYVDTFRDSAKKLPEMMQLKYIHTAMVMKNAELIADGENFSDAERFASLSAALFHDIGRYEQLKRFNTFKDSDSIDHAVFSHDIVKSHEWLAQQGALCPTQPILDAVRYHNRRDLPDGLDALTSIASRTVRDADKLDIFRVLEDRVVRTDWRADTRAFWNLQSNVAPNPMVVEAIRARRPVEYQNIKSLADFVLIQVGWMISGLCFSTSRRLCIERGHLAFRRQFLSEIGGGRIADELCDLAENSLGTR